MVVVPKWQLFQLFFKGNIGQENFFHYILERRNAFLRYKNKKFKQSKIHLFPRGLTHGFGPLMAFFKLFFLGNIGQENVFHDILERKNAFLGYKKNPFQTVENCHFSKGVNPCCWSNKWTVLPIFFRQF